MGKAGKYSFEFLTDNLRNAAVRVSKTFSGTVRRYRAEDVRR